MPGWVPFTALTLAVLFLLLGLARLSQRVVDDSRAEPTPSAFPESDDVTASDGSAGDRSAGDRSASDGSAAVSISGEIDPDGETASSTTGDGSVERDVAPSPSRPRTGARSPEELTTGALLANVALTQGLFGAVVAAGAWYYEIPRTALGLSGGPLAASAAVGVGVVFGVVLWTANEVSATVADAVGATYDEALRELLAPDGLGGWLLLLGLILPIIAVVEELIFRAALVGVPAAGFGISPWALAVLSSVAFALGHGAQGRVGVAVTGGLGFVLAAGYVLSGSLIVVVVAHYLVNALEFVVHEGLGLDRFVA